MHKLNIFISQIVEIGQVYPQLNQCTLQTPFMQGDENECYQGIG